ncbi:UDP-glycosyltransferase UGT5 isoform X3 [Diabrotica virgifera virgifera]|uniref:UDP-glucuronosyltransferase n=1 Tax=Diabrotica virgifera virgifera TaxID=50390 RepID=A0ABM5IW20_DIAVI|nr:UDP-glycosyltransferase UGT5 isoform X3 [Diabrotica virgifera virgifera]
MKLVAIVAIFMCSVALTRGYRILGVFSYCGHSHFSLGYRIASELAARGHDVTMITCNPQNKGVKNLKEVSVEGFKRHLESFNADLADFGQMSFWGQLEWIKGLGIAYTEYVLTAPEVKQLWNSNQEFDLVVMEHFINDAATIFHHRFNCPLVILAPGPMSMMNNYLVGNLAPPSYVPSILGNYDAEMNYWERLSNTYKFIMGEIFMHTKFIPAHNELLKRVFPDAPDLNTILYNASLILITSHVSLIDAMPLQQNIKEIGGYHVTDPEPLPKNLIDFLDSAKNGAIIFSMGSNLKSSDFEPEKKRAILKAFSKIKQKVLWKFETDLPEKSDNVMISSWLPQKDALAHPNVIGFIGHGGLLGTIEAIYHGVPILGMPIFWDQMKNIEEAVRKGYGVKLNFADLTEETFEKSLNELINNPKYREGAKTRSKIMHDQPTKQIDEAMFWIEYVVRHKGAPHLRSQSVKLRWYQLYLLDVIALPILAVVILVFVIRQCVNFVVFSKKSSNKKAKKH